MVAIVVVVTVAEIEDFVSEELLIEGGSGVRIARDERAPDPLAGRREEIVRIPGARLERGKHGTLRIREDGLPAPLRIRFSGRENLAAAREDHLLGLAQIANR